MVDWWNGGMVEWWNGGLFASLMSSLRSVGGLVDLWNGGLGVGWFFV